MSTTPDPSLPGLGRNAPADWAHVEKYPVSKLLALTGVAPVQWMDWACPVVTDQGHFPYCVGHSCAGWLSTVASRQYGETLNFDANAIYTWANAHDGDPTPHDGSSVRAGMECLTQVGGVDLDQSPPEPGGVEKLAQYLWATTAQQAVDYLLTVGPIVIGINWYDSMFEPDHRHICHITPTATVAGGHAILVDVVNVRDGWIGLHNSWGRAWGDNGRAWLTMEDFDRLLGEDGEASCASVTKIV